MFGLSGFLRHGSATNRTISFVMGGLFNFTKTGSSTWTVSAANTYTGTTTVSAGTLNSTITNTASTTSGLGAATNPIVVASGATLELTATGAGRTTVMGGISGAGTITRRNTTQGMTLGGDNSGFTGTFNKTTTARHLYFTSETAGSAAAAWVMNSDGTNPSYNAFCYGTTVGDAWVSGMSSGSHTIYFGSVSGTDANAEFGNYAFNASLTANTTAEVGANGSSTTYAGKIVDTVAGSIPFTSSVLNIRKVGAGTWTLTGTNTHTGVTTISAGALSVATIGNGGVAGNMGAATSAASNWVMDGGTFFFTGVTASTNRAMTLTAATTSTLENADALNFAKVLTLNGAITGTGNLIYKGFWAYGGATNTYTGNTTLQDGYLSVSAATTTLFGTSAGTVTFSGTSQVAIGQAGSDVTNPLVLNSTYTEGEGALPIYLRQGCTISGAIALSSDQGILCYAGSGGAPTVSGVISGAFDWHINNSPLTTAIGITLSGNNTYTGYTVVHRATCTQTGTVAHAGVKCYFSAAGGSDQTTGKYVYPASPDLSAQTIDIIASGVTAGAVAVVLVSWASGTATGTPTIKYNGATQAFGVPFADGARTITLTYSTTTGVAITTV